MLQGGNKAIWQVIFGLDIAKLFVLHCAGVAKLADAQDLKSWAWQRACGFDSRPRHHVYYDLEPFTFLSLSAKS